MISPFRFFVTAVSVFAILLAVSIFNETSVTAQDPEVFANIREFEKVMKGTPFQKQQAAAKVLRRYKEYQQILQTSGDKVSAATRAALDDQLGRMTRETWTEVGRRYPNKVSHVIPVGTYGTRNKAGSKYKPGFSDKDFIPQGNDPAGATRLFNEAFERKWGVHPEKLDVNVLDPTNIDGWKSRTAAIGNTEKYNTRGGNNWLNKKLKADNPEVWQLDRKGNLTETTYENWLTKNKGSASVPTELHQDDALGFFSDNTRFRQNWKSKWQSGQTSAVELAEHQAKYDLRNLEALEAAGEKLTADEKRLMNIAEMLRDPNRKKRAVDACMALTGKSNADDAVRAYLTSMDGLNQRMGSKILNKHISRMAELLKDGKPTGELANELVSSISNLPARYADEAKDVAIRSIGYAEWNEIDKISKSLKSELHRARTSAEYFDDMARHYFGKAYDKLDDAERAVLHGADDVAEGFGQRVGRVLGVSAGAAFAIWAIHDSYTKGIEQGESGYAQAFGRAAIELVQLGYPPLVAAELAGRLTAGVTEICASSYTERQIDELLAKYKQDPSMGMDGLLATYGTDRFRAGALRQLAIEIRQLHPGLNLTEAMIDKKIKEHLQRRLRNERQQQAFDRFVHRAESWINRYDIPLLVGGNWITSLRDNAELKRTDPKKYYELLGELMQRFYEIRSRLVAEKRPFAEKEVWYELFKIYRGRPPQRDVAAESGKSGKKAKKARVLHTSRSRIKRPEKIASDSQDNAGKLTVGQVLSSPSGAWKEKIDQFDPPRVVDVIDVPCGGTVLAKMTGVPPAPNKWSLGNGNTGIVVSFRRKMGEQLGAPVNILSTAGKPMESKYQQEGSWEGAGQLTVTVSSARGSGPLTGGQFDQTYSGTVTVTKVSTESSLLVGTSLIEGDEISSDGLGYSILDLEPARVWVGPNTRLNLLSDNPGVQRTFELGSGKIRYVNRAKNSGDNSRFHLKFETSTPEDQINRRSFVVMPTGTDFEIENLGDKGTLKVFEGQVVLADEQGIGTVVEAGQQVQLPEITVSEMGDAKVDVPQVDGLSMMELLGGGGSLPGGEYQAEFSASQPTGDWDWIDPRHDASVEVLGARSIRVTVPDGNELWGFNNQAPRILHKVTGDFDVQAQLHLKCEGMDNAMWKWVVFSPGSYIGFHARQMRNESSGKDYRVLCDAFSHQLGLKFNPVYGRESIHDFAPLNDEPIHIRATRRGNLFKTYWSRDGKRWTLSSRHQIELPNHIWVGGAMQRMAYDGRRGSNAVFTLNDLVLRTADRGTMKIPEWDFVQCEGTIDVNGNRFQLTIPSGSEGSLLAISGEPWKGALDVKANFETLGFRAEPKTLNAIQLIAFNEDESNYVYVNRLHTDSAPNRFATDLKFAKGWYRGYQFEEASETAGGLRLMRKGEKWLGMIPTKYSWKRLDKGFTVGFEDPVYLAIRVDKTGENTKERTFAASVKIEGWKKETSTGAGQHSDKPAKTKSGEPALPSNFNVLASLGIETLSATLEVTRALGLKGAAAVVKIRSNAVVTRVDIQQGDMITHVNSFPIDSPAELDKELRRACAAGKKAVYLKLIRPEKNVSVGITLPLPVYGQKYRHPEGHYSVKIPNGWFQISGFRSRVADPGFDSLLSPDLKQVVIISRYGIPMSDPVRDLQEYVEAKQNEAQRFQNVQTGPMKQLGVPAFRVAYAIPQQNFAISRVAFAIGNQRLILNIVNYQTRGTALTQEEEGILGSFTQLKQSSTAGQDVKPVIAPSEKIPLRKESP